jgi:hypothetical protein
LLTYNALADQQNPDVEGVRSILGALERNRTVTDASLCKKLLFVVYVDGE